MATLPNAPDPNEANLNDAVKLELLRKRNLELHAEIEQLKFKSEFRSYSRKITGEFSSWICMVNNFNDILHWHIVVDTRRLELVWMFLPAIPWNIFWYTNDRGAEYTQLYFWIVKVLIFQCWVVFSPCFIYWSIFASSLPIALQDWAWIVRSYRWGIIIGALSCAWSVCVCAKSIVNGNWREMCHSFCIFLWLLGTYLWETGDLHDHQFPHGQPVAHIRRMECSYLLIIALILHGIYFFFLRPKLPNKSSPFITALSKPFVDNMKGMTGYDEPRLKFQTWHFKCTPVFSMTVWRDYEAAQIFFWIGKDLAAVRVSRQICPRSWLDIICWAGAWNWDHVDCVLHSKLHLVIVSDQHVAQYTCKWRKRRKQRRTLANRVTSCVMCWSLVRPLSFPGPPIYPLPHLPLLPLFPLLIFLYFNVPISQRVLIDHCHYLATVGQFPAKW